MAISIDDHATLPDAPNVLLLGHLQVVDGSRPDQVRSVRGLGARLLTMLAIEPGDGCADEVLIDRLWMGAPPRNASFSLRNQIAGLRRLLRHDAVVRVPGGYRLDRTAAVTDLDVVDALAVAAGDAERRGDVATALALTNAALRLVRGPALSEVRHESWAVRAAEAADERVRVLEDLWSSATLRGGVAVEHLVRLRELVDSAPHREVRWSNLIDAHVAVGQRAEALRIAHEARRALAAVGLRVGTGILAAEQAALSSPGAVLPRRGLPQLLAARTAPWEGPADLLAALLAAPRIAVVDGGSATDATRLVAEVAWQADQRGDTVVHVRADGAPDEASFIGALAMELVAAADRSHIDPLLRPLLVGPGAEPPPHDVSTTSALQQRALQRLIGELVEAAPLLMVVDDAHRLRDDDQRLVRALSSTAPEGARTVLAGRSVGAAEYEWWRRLLPPGSTADGASGDVVLVHLARDRADADERFEVDQVLSGLDADASAVFAALASLDRPVESWVVAAAVGRPVADVDVLLTALEESGVVVRDGSRLRAAIDDPLDPPRSVPAWSQHRRAARRALIDDPDVRRREPGLVFGLLLDEGVAGDGDAVLLDDVFVVVARDLIAAGALVAANDAARRFVAVAGNGSADRASVTARLVAATALLASADTTAAGMALLELVEARARALGEPELVADAVLARGPVDTGGRRSRRTADEAEALAAQLSAGDVRRRVQLLCWAAHHRINLGEVPAALTLLDEADRAASSVSQPTWRSLVLGVRAQAQLAALGSPTGAVDALTELDRWAALTGDLTASAASRLLAIGWAFGASTLSDAEQAIAALAEFSDTLPRPDLRWFPATALAAVALARAEVDHARRAIDAAAEQGRALGVSGAVPAAMSQHLVLALADGTVGGMAALTEAAAAGDRPGIDRLAVHGLVCTRIGEPARAATVAAQLTARGPLLPGTGATWPVVAMAVAELAAATGNATLGETLWNELRGWSGWGLNVNGVVYLGAADTWLGAAAATAGRPVVAAELLAAGIAQDQRRGATLWVDRGRELAVSLGIDLPSAASDRAEHLGEMGDHRAP